MAQDQGGFFAKFVKKYKPGGNSVKNQNGNDTASGGSADTIKGAAASDSSNSLDIFDNLFTAPDPSKKKQAPAFALNDETVKKAVEKMDFVGGLPQELKDKLAAGYDPEAFSAAIQHVGRTAYSNALQHGTKLTDQYLGIRMEHERQGLPELLRSHLAQTAATSDPSMSENATVRKHAKLISEQLAAEFPDASPQDIASLTKEYFTEMARAVNPAAFANQSNGDDNSPLPARGGVDVEDWGSYLKLDKGPQSGKVGNPQAGTPPVPSGGPQQS